MSSEIWRLRFRRTHNDVVAGARDTRPCYDVAFASDNLQRPLRFCSVASPRLIMQDWRWRRAVGWHEFARALAAGGCAGDGIGGDANTTSAPCLAYTTTRAPASSSDRETSQYPRTNRNGTSACVSCRQTPPFCSASGASAAAPAVARQRGWRHAPCATPRRRDSRDQLARERLHSCAHACSDVSM